MSVEIIAAYIVFGFRWGGDARAEQLPVARIGDTRRFPANAAIRLSVSVSVSRRCSGLSAPDSVSFFLRVPEAQIALKILGTAYFLWLAWRLVTARAVRGDEARPLMGFWTGAAFQYVNPKAWLICITAVSLYLPSGSGLDALALLVLLAIAVGMPANLAWAGAGQGMRHFIASPLNLRRFNLVMAALLALSIIPVWLS